MVKQRRQHWHSVGGGGRFVSRRAERARGAVSCSESRVRFTGGLVGGSRRVQAVGVLDCGTGSVIGGGACATGLKRKGGGESSSSCG